jgi:hypothetical protein
LARYSPTELSSGLAGQEFSDLWQLRNQTGEPETLQISFHTLRYWKTTMLHRKTRDPHNVRDLGRRGLRNTEIYINIERTILEPTNDEFTVKVAKKPEEVKSLLEVGFEHVSQKDNLIFLRKHK